MEGLHLTFGLSSCPSSALLFHSLPQLSDLHDSISDWIGLFRNEAHIHPWDFNQGPPVR